MQRKDAQPIGEIISQILKEQNLDIRLDETKVVQAWNSIMGESVAQYTTSVRMKAGVLYIQLSSAVLRNELFVNRTSILRRLNGFIGREIVKNIIFR